MNADAFDPPRIRLQDFKFQAAVVLDDFAARRNAARHFENQPAQRIRFVLFLVREEINAEQLVNGGNLHAGVGHIDVVVLALDQLLVIRVVLIGNVADNFLNQVFNRNEPVTAAILVNDDGHVNVAGLHLEQQVGGRHGGGHKKHFAVDPRLLDRQRQILCRYVDARVLCLGFRLCPPERHPAHEILHVDHARDVIKGFAVNRQPGMVGLVEFGEQLAHRGAVLDGDDVGPRHHRVINAQA